jgi:uncharacterized phage-like protein YoqJ
MKEYLMSQNQVRFVIYQNEQKSKIKFFLNKSKKN